MSFHSTVCETLDAVYRTQRLKRCHTHGVTLDSGKVFPWKADRGKVFTTVLQNVLLEDQLTAT